MKHINTVKNAGFTLLELSIVLVIIGLVVGGVLVGTDLIKSAKLQKVIREVQGYQNAVATFKLKYGGMPGDMRGASNFFPGAVFNADATNWQGSDALPGDGYINAGLEGADAWRQLALAGLINASNMEGAERCGADATDSQFCGQLRGVTAPASSFNDKGAWQLGVQYTEYISSGYGSGGAVNQLLFTAASRDFGNGHTWYTGGKILTSLAAYNIDSKIDDGFPTTGSVRNASYNSSASSSESEDRKVLRCVLDDVTPRTYIRLDGEAACTLAFPLGI